MLRSWWGISQRMARPLGLKARPTLRPELEELEARTLLSGTGTWTQLTNPLPDPYGGETMFLLNNGTVMVQGGGGGMSNAWYQLTPTSTGSYVNGTWSGLASMSEDRLYYSSNLLTNGNEVIIGAEYTGPDAERTLDNSGTVYNPASNTWSSIATMPVAQQGEAPSMLLPNGDILVGWKGGPQTYLYNPGTNTWTQGPTKLYNDSNDEESWVKLPDNSVLSYDIWSSQTNGGQAQRYVPSQNAWVSAGTVPVILSTGDTDNELGPGLRLNDGRVFFLGATGATALYTESTNTWVAGPTIPNGYVTDDAPGAVLPNGQVIFAADQGDYDGPTALFDYDPVANTITQLPLNDPNLAYNPAFVNRMLVLPTGQLLFCDASDTLWVYTPNGGPLASWQPQLNLVTVQKNVYTLSGTALNGQSAGAGYGDDAEMDENFPIVRLTSSSGQVIYATTSGWSYTGVGSGTQETVNFTLPAGVTSGLYTLQDIGAGIASGGYSLQIGGSGGGHGIGGSVVITSPVLAAGGRSGLVAAPAPAPITLRLPPGAAGPVQEGGSVHQQVVGQPPTAAAVSDGSTSVAASPILSTTASPTVAAEETVTDLQVPTGFLDPPL